MFSTFTSYFKSFINNTYPVNCKQCGTQFFISKTEYEDKKLIPCCSYSCSVNNMSNYGSINNNV